MVQDRSDKPTDKVKQLDSGDRVTIELGEAEQAAEFLEYIAMLIRTRKKITIWVE